MNSQRITTHEAIVRVSPSRCHRRAEVRTGPRKADGGAGPLEPPPAEQAREAVRTVEAQPEVASEHGWI